MTCFSALLFGKCVEDIISPHVIFKQAYRIVAVICNCACSVTLTGSVFSTANLSRVVPHGLLVFFPSFPLMEKTLEFWRVSGSSHTFLFSLNTAIKKPTVLITGWKTK